MPPAAHVAFEPPQSTDYVLFSEVLAQYGGDLDLYAALVRRGEVEVFRAPCGAVYVSRSQLLPAIFEAIRGERAIALLRDHRSAAAAAAEDDLVVTVRQAGLRLGLSAERIQRACNDGRIPAAPGNRTANCVRRRWLVRLGDVRRFFFVSRKLRISDANAFSSIVSRTNLNQ